MLYGSLEDLLERSMVHEVERKSNRPTRTSHRYRYLDLTPAGREALAAETEEYQEVIRLARDLLTREASS
jgi:hypothetical protein